MTSLLTQDFTADLPDIVKADGGTMWDSSLGRAKKTILTLTWMVAINKSIGDLCDVFGEDWLENSPFYVGIPLPEGFSAVHDFVIAYKGKKLLIEPHNGYVFGGGHGDEILGEVPGEYPAYDCSSFSAHYYGMLDAPDAKAPSTLHWFLHAIKSGAEKPFSGHDDV